MSKFTKTVWPAVTPLGQKVEITNRKGEPVRFPEIPGGWRVEKIEKPGIEIVISKIGQEMGFLATCGVHTNPRRIETGIERMPLAIRSDFVKDEEATFGHSMAEAVGRQVMKHPERFGVSIKILDKEICCGEDEEK